MSKKIISTIVLSVVACAMLVVMTAFAPPSKKTDAASPVEPTSSISVTPVAAIPALNSSEIADCDFSDLMFDEYGELYGEEVFIANVDKAIADGLLDADYKELLLDMYGACVVESDGGGMPCSPQDGGMMGMDNCPFSK